MATQTVEDIIMVLKFMMIGACAPWSFGLFKQSINLCLYHGVNGSCVVLVLRHVYDCMFALMYLFFWILPP